MELRTMHFGQAQQIEQTYFFSLEAELSRIKLEISYTVKVVVILYPNFEKDYFQAPSLNTK